jgi:hypothetical protein
MCRTKSCIGISLAGGFAQSVCAALTAWQVLPQPVLGPRCHIVPGCIHLQAREPSKAQPTLFNMPVLVGEGC